MEKKIEEFLSLQENRVKRYNILHEAHKKYLSTGPDYDIEEYKKQVSEATEDFKLISEKIMALEKDIAETEGIEGREVAGFIADIQHSEELNLRFTVDFQLAAQQAQDSPEDELAEKNVKGIKKMLAEVAEEINENLNEIRCKLYDIKQNLGWYNEQASN